MTDISLRYFAVRLRDADGLPSGMEHVRARSAACAMRIVEDRGIDSRIIFARHPDDPFVGRIPLPDGWSAMTRATWCGTTETDAAIEAVLDDEIPDPYLSTSER